MVIDPIERIADRATLDFALAIVMSKLSRAWSVDHADEAKSKAAAIR